MTRLWNIEHDRGPYPLLDCQGSVRFLGRGYQLRTGHVHQAQPRGSSEEQINESLVVQPDLDAHSQVSASQKDTTSSETGSATEPEDFSDISRRIASRLG